MSGKNWKDCPKSWLWENLWIWLVTYSHTGVSRTGFIPNFSRNGKKSNLWAMAKSHKGEFYREMSPEPAQLKKVIRPQGTFKHLWTDKIQEANISHLTYPVHLILTYPTNQPQLMLMIHCIILIESTNRLISVMMLIQSRCIIDFLPFHSQNTVRMRLGNIWNSLLKDCRVIRVSI